MHKLITYLVEDNLTVLTSLIDTLQETASVRVAAHSATEAEANLWLQMHDGLWRLTIVDLFLKEGNGLGVVAGCRHRKSCQKVVVLSNYTNHTIRQRAEALGADAVFDKSTQLAELIDYCRQLACHSPV